MKKQLNNTGFSFHAVFVVLLVLGIVGIIGHLILTRNTDLQNTALYTPNVSVQFNDPYGSSVEQYAIINHVNSFIDATPPGATINIASYGFNVQSTATSLVNAFQRGVHVRVLLGDSLSGQPYNQLVQALGTNKSAASFVFSCKYGCMSDNPQSIMHVKLYQFSQSGSSKYVSMTGSSNLTNSMARHDWNDLETVVNRPKLYAGYNKYFNDMLQDKANPNYAHEITDGNFSAYLYPGMAAKTQNMLSALNQVRCSGAATGYGNATGHTVIRVGMFAWKNSDLPVAKKLQSLYSQGCDVAVMVSAINGRLSPGIITALLKPSSLTGQPMPLYNTASTAHYHTHQKYLSISGVYGKNNHAKIVYSGSTNFITSNTALSNNILTVFRSDPIYNAFMANDAAIISHNSSLVTSLSQLPAITPAASATSSDAMVESD